MRVSGSGWGLISVSGFQNQKQNFVPLPAAEMYRGPARPPRSPGTPGRFPSPASCLGFPGPRLPYGASGHRGASPGGGGAFSPRSPGYSPGPHRASRAPAGFGGASRGCGGQMWRRSGRFQPGSPVSVHRFQVKFRRSVFLRVVPPGLRELPSAD